MKRYDNSSLIVSLLALRLEEAKLLGYPNFASLSLVPKMAESPQHVIDFLRDLALKAKPFAQQDLADLRAFASEHLQLKDPEAWDWPYVSEQLKEARYAFNEQELKQYFPLPTVIGGLFKIVETLFEVSIREDHAPVWHESVRFYRIERSTAQGAKELVGQFYLDPAARDGKRGSTVGRSAVAVRDDMFPLSAAHARAWAPRDTHARARATPRALSEPAYPSSANA